MNKKLLLILIFSVLLRFFFLTNFPYRVDGDASKMALDGISAWNNHIPLFGTGWFGNTNPDFYLIGLFIKLFGQNLFAVRIFSGLGGVLSVYSTYLLAKELFDKRVALIATFLLSVMSLHLVFSRLGTDIIYSSFFVTFTAYLVLLSIRKRLAFGFLAGLILGLSQYFYQANKFINLLVVFVYFILFFQKNLRKKTFQSFALTIMGFLLIYSPMIGYYMKSPDAYFSKIKDSVLFYSPKFLSFLIFFKKIETTPMHFLGDRFITVLDSILLMAGIVISFIKIKEQAVQILFFWLIAGLAFSGVITRSLPQAGRYVIYLPVVAIFIALVLRKLKKKLIYFILAITAVVNIYTYVNYEQIVAFRKDSNTQIATYAGRYLMKTSGNYNIYFVGNSNMYYQAIPTLPFLTKNNGVDIEEPLEKYFVKVTPTKRSFYIIIPSRRDQVNILESKFPNGKEIEFHNPRGDLLFSLFETRSS